MALQRVSTRVERLHATLSACWSSWACSALSGACWRRLNRSATSFRALHWGDAVQDVFERLKSGLQAPLAGMGTAFSSSLFGLAGSLVLGYLALQAGQAQNRFYNDLEEWLSVKHALAEEVLSETVNSRFRLYPSLAGTDRRQSGKPTADFARGEQPYRCEPRSSN